MLIRSIFKTIISSIHVVAYKGMLFDLSFIILMCRIHIFLQGSTLYFIYWYIISILSLSHTLPYSVNEVRRRSKFSIRSSPSTCVSCPLFIRRSPFLIRRMRSLSGEVRSVRRKVLCMLKTWNGLHRTKASAGCTVAMRWHAFCSELVCSLSRTCPFTSVDVQWTWFAAGLLPDMQRVNRWCSGHLQHVQRTITDKDAW